MPSHQINQFYLYEFKRGISEEPIYQFWMTKTSKCVHLRVLETYNHHINWKQQQQQQKTAALLNYDKEEKMRWHCTVK